MATSRHHLSAEYHPVLKEEPVEWIIESGILADYESCVMRMECRADAIFQGTAPECVWLVEHTPLYTAGTSAKIADLMSPERFPVYRTGRGGEYTYHGPGQRVAYVMLNLQRRKPDIRAFVGVLEQWIIKTLNGFNINAERCEDRVGVWVRRPDKPPLPDGDCREDKIAAIGIRVRRWVSFHGISINVEPDLTHYDGIVPCGIAGHGVTSLADLGLPVTVDDLDVVLKQNFEGIFGETTVAGSMNR